MRDDYEFSVDWFSQYWQNWLTLTAGLKISKILEIGSFEGRSACTMIEHFSQTAPLEVFCIDHWRNDFEHGAFDMEVVEKRFNHNINRAITSTRHPVSVYKHKGNSIDVMSSFLVDGHKGTFDLIFIDGSHQAPDVLSDLVLAYHLCATDGLIICDDYLWSEMPHGREDLLEMPRLAINAFANLFIRKVALWGGLPLYQVYFRKTG
jgi:predicted O-methyltransferase YrrM